MTLLDWLILAIIVISGAISVIRGFVKEAISLATWIIAFWIALVFAPKLALLLPAGLEGDLLRWSVAAVALFMGTLLVGGLTNFLISTLVEKTGLSGTDRSLGVVFGVLRGVVIVALLILVAGDTALREEQWWESSRLRPAFDTVAQGIRDHYPADVAESLLAPGK